MFILHDHHSPSGNKEWLHFDTTFNVRRMRGYDSMQPCTHAFYLTTPDITLIKYTLGMNGETMNSLILLFFL